MRGSNLPERCPPPYPKRRFPAVVIIHPVASASATVPTWQKMEGIEAVFKPRTRSLFCGSQFYRSTAACSPFHLEKNLPTMLLAMLPARFPPLKALPAMFDAWLNLSHREKASELVMVKTRAMARRNESRLASAVPSLLPLPIPFPPLQCKSRGTHQQAAAR